MYEGVSYVAKLKIGSGCFLPAKDEYSAHVFNLEP